METTCAREGCGKTFFKKVHNQRFCCSECTRIFTNARILAQYHEKKNKVMKGRVCIRKGCGTLLSAYNDDDMCSVHQQEAHQQKLRNWGWVLNEDGEIIT